MSVITFVSAVLNVSTGSPNMKFSVKSASVPVPSSISVKFDAVVNNDIQIFSQQYQNFNIVNGIVTIPIPFYTSALKVYFRNVVGNTNLGIQYVPQDQQYSFDRPDRDLFLTINHCNAMAIDASGYDHANARQQAGPHRSSRALAMVHIAMMEAYICLNGGYVSFLNLARAPNSVYSIVDTTRVALLQSCYATLIALFSAQSVRLNALLVSMMSKISDSPDKALGILVGMNSSNAILANRANDGSNHAEVSIGAGYTPGGAPGEWDMDPISQMTVALGAHWADLVPPFVLQSAHQFRCPAPPALNSVDYANAFNEVKALGGDGTITRTVRSEDAKEIGIFWAYDGVPTLCAPPRLYNEVAKGVLFSKAFLTAAKLLHTLTVLNVAMADTGIAAWESKYYYKIGRPITNIRAATADGNSLTIQDNTWTPLGAPATNISGGIDFSPPFPAYPSGHATFGGTLGHILRTVIGTDDSPFTFLSDEYNGVTEDSHGNIRPYKPRSYQRISQMEEDNGQSRIYLGIHFNFDKTEGIIMGHSIGDYVYNHIYPVV